jgi:hypothetical protein
MSGPPVRPVRHPVSWLNRESLWGLGSARRLHLLIPVRTIRRNKRRLSRESRGLDCLRSP